MAAIKVAQGAGAPLSQIAEALSGLPTHSTPADERERPIHGDPYDELTTRSFNTLMNSGGVFKQF